MTTSQNDLPYRVHAIQGQAWHLDASNMMATSMSILQCMWMTLQYNLRTQRALQIHWQIPTASN
jgi:hypothetical protein